MQENYLISILGRQQVDGETGEVQVTTLGSYVKKGKNRYITYKEYDSDSQWETGDLRAQGGRERQSDPHARCGGAPRLVLEERQAPPLPVRHRLWKHDDWDLHQPAFTPT